MGDTWLSTMKKLFLGFQDYISSRVYWELKKLHITWSYFSLEQIFDYIT